MISCTCSPSALTSAHIVRKVVQGFMKCDAIEGINKISHVIDTSGSMFRKKLLFFWDGETLLEVGEGKNPFATRRRRSCFKSFRARIIKIQSLFRRSISSSRNCFRWSREKTLSTSNCFLRGRNQTWTAFMKKVCWVKRGGFSKGKLAAFAVLF